MSIPRYPLYKPSGVEWLGDVPEHWEARPLWTCFRRTKRVGHEAEPLLSVYRDHGVVRKDSRGDNFNKPSEDVATYQLVEVGDLAINKMKAWQGSVGISSERGIVSPAYFVYTPYHQDEPRYLHYLMRSVGYVHGYLTISKGIRINQWDMEPQLHRCLPLLLPPLPEQVRIAKFLDQQASRTEALVAEQQRLLELLGEKRQAIISHAITKGLNRGVSMKPTGLAGVGTIPSHWRVERIKWVALMDSGHTPDKKVAAYWEGGEIPWVSLNDTGHLRENEFISDTAVCVTEAGLANSSAHLLPPNAVIFSRDATIGRCAITTRPMAVSQHFIAWLCGCEIEPEYLLFRLRSMTQELERLTTGATVKTIGMPEVRTLCTPVPPIDEQKQIVAAIWRATRELDALAEEAQRAITLLQERRAALISAAVTGQIDLRALVEQEVA